MDRLEIFENRFTDLFNAFMDAELSEDRRQGMLETLKIVNYCIDNAKKEAHYTDNNL